MFPIGGIAFKIALITTCRLGELDISFSGRKTRPIFSNFIFDKIDESMFSRAKSASPYISRIPVNTTIQVFIVINSF